MVPPRRRRPTAPPEALFESSHGVKARCNSLASHESLLQTMLTVSSLLIGVSIALLSMLSAENVELTISEWLDARPDAQARLEYSFEIIYDAAVACSYLGFLFSGMQFGFSLPLYISLRALDIHPEDFTSATNWEDGHALMLNGVLLLSPCAYLALALSTMASVNLYVRPTVFGEFTSYFAALFLPFLVYGLIHIYVSHQKIKSVLANDRGVEGPGGASVMGISSSMVAPMPSMRPEGTPAAGPAWPPTKK